MKKVGLVGLGLIAALLVATGSLAVSGEQAAVGQQIFYGQPLTVGVRLDALTNEFQGNVYLPCSGYLYVFYWGGPGTEEYLIFPAPRENNYRRPGINKLPLSAIYPTGRYQKLTVIFSLRPLLKMGIGCPKGRFLSVREIQEQGLWSFVGPNSYLVGKLVLPTVYSASQRPYACSVAIQPLPPAPPSPPPSCCWVAANPCWTASCCPAWRSLFWWWLLTGVMLGH